MMPRSWLTFARIKISPDCTFEFNCFSYFYQLVVFRLPAQKSGLKLGNRDFREPESSATILHVALLYNHIDIVDFLISTGDRDLLLARYETAEYHNQTCLHVAVANGNDTVVERLILALDSEVGAEWLLVNTANVPPCEQRCV
jgi:ankyrin repeat protein